MRILLVMAENIIVDIIFGLAGGLALFLFGMKLLSEGLQKAAGHKLKTMLTHLTNRPIKGIFTGAFITSVVQSSSITTVTIVGLINAGLMTLPQAITVIMGANIGTTITAQILNLPPMDTHCRGSVFSSNHRKGSGQKTSFVTIRVDGRTRPADIPCFNDGH